jgi:ATP-binding cassette, subfamily C (CFTR/MRP), member 1
MQGGMPQTVLGASPLWKLGSDSIFESKTQPLCGNIEGWGPISSIRYDFTPCFLDVWISLVAAWGLVVGAGALWYLLKRKEPQEVPKNWHFYAKLVSQELILSRLSSGRLWSNC